MTTEPSIAPNSPCMLNRRYEYVRTIGRGGMGEVFLVRDRQLQRELALKVLSDSRASEPAFVDRFVEEAQIAAQLQHPGIVPIHEIGKLDDQRPYFTMKLVKGKTLDSLLAQRSGMNDSLDRWLNVFLQVCQAVAYDHAKGVIHRDLKPSNIIVDRFGEVQVMDWGLAKILAYPSSPTSANIASTLDDDPPAKSTSLPLGFAPVFDSESSLPHPTIIRSIRYSPSEEEFSSTQRSLEWRTDAGSLTNQGYVLGTVAFMPPEQARGCVDQIDSRCDVFALGAILCVILTGKPPYYSESDVDRFQMATKGDLAECIERLRASTHDKELIEVCVHCLSPDPAERPRDATLVVSQISEYLTKVRQRLHQAELESAEAAAKLEAAVESRKIEKQRQRWVRATAVSIGASIVLGLASLAWIRQKESDLRLAVSKQKLASLEREQERSQRIDQSRVALEQIAAPMRLLIEQLTDSEQIPTHAQLQQLTFHLAQTQTAYDGADREVRQQWDLVEWQRQLERLRFLAQICQQLPHKIDQEWLSANFGVDLSRVDPDTCPRRVHAESASVG